MTSENFEQVLKDQAAGFATEIKKIIGMTADVQSVQVEVGSIARSLQITNDFITSVSFVGMVTGEFILAVSTNDVRKLFPDFANDEEIRDGLAETLNMVAGSRIGELSAIFQKLTITPPKLVTGQIHYRDIKNIQIHITTEKGVLDAFFYIDLMSLDLANSYRSIFHGLKQANEKLTEANRQLVDQQTQLIHSEKMASLGMIAAGVAHEINNPLAFVLSNANVLATYVETMRLLLSGQDKIFSLYEAGNLNEAKIEMQKINNLKQDEDINFILEDTKKLLADSKLGLDRIRGIVSGLKRFSRVDDGGLKRVQLNEEIQTALMLLQNELKYKCTVKTDLRAMREVECYPSEINQVVVNLIVNAAQAMKNQEGLLEVITEDSANFVIIRVRDTGVGISPENMTKLFSPFFTTKPAGEGTGLGLAISQGIVHKHGGTLKVESTIGTGTEFVIQLPYDHKVIAHQGEVKVNGGAAS